ncbi:MAG: hypothetical protein WB992_11250, partial [Bryobacteraceae bacterium]
PREKMSIHLLNLTTRQLSEVPGSKGLWSPRWSPDGRYIAATATDFSTLYITHWKNPRWRQIAGMFNIDHAAWSADSRYIYFDGRDEAGQRDLFRVSIPQGKLDRLADLRKFVMPDEHWFGVARDGAPLALQATSVKEIWAMKYVLP